ncbi:MAG TPA: hypothetical protein VE673_13665, partial [Pseudonocardiaceae bacterium]|nr:hypothetical protein [Pseudonocardiaceae bacterium]
MQRCGREYPGDRDGCADCRGLDAELIDTGGDPGRFGPIAGFRPILAIRQVTVGLWASPPGAYCAVA